MFHFNFLQNAWKLYFVILRCKITDFFFDFFFFTVHLYCFCEIAKQRKKKKKQTKNTKPHSFHSINLVWYKNQFLPMKMHSFSQRHVLVSIVHAKALRSEGKFLLVSDYFHG